MLEITLVDLLLQTEGQTAPTSAELATAVTLIDSLQLAELENFLRCNLLPENTNQSDIAEGSESEAFIYPIILEDRLAVIFKLPGEPFGYYASTVPRAIVKETLQKLRRAMARRNPENFREASQKVYQWLILPLESRLANSTKTKTLVFVLDSYLRNIPMAVLYDEKAGKYLLEKPYSLAVLPTSQLFSRQVSRKTFNILAAGVSEAQEVENRQFEAIKAQEELQQVKAIAPTEILLNQKFTRSNLQASLQTGDFSVLHLATHGNFSSEPENTFLLTYGELLRANEFSDLLIDSSGETPRIDLLVLSACKTASGDDRATLGLAGLAIRAGADSTLATLWRVSDRFTLQLITRFYRELNQGATRAEALHQAQKELLYEEINGKVYPNDPYDWGPYILVGNWQ